MAGERMRIPGPVASGARSSFRALSGAWLLVLLLALAALPAPRVAARTVGPALEDAAADPARGTASTLVTMSVTYRSGDGFPAQLVRVTAGGRVHAMASTGDRQNWRKGVRFSVVTTLPPGSWIPRFEAFDEIGARAELDGPVVTISGPPLPTPTPAPTITPRPTSTPAPTATPRATPRPTPAPTATPRPTPAPTATPRPTPAPAATATPTPRPTQGRAPSGTPAPSATRSPEAPGQPGSGRTPDPAGPGASSDAGTPDPGGLAGLPGVVPPGGGATGPRGPGPDGPAPAPGADGGTGSPFPGGAPAGLLPLLPALVAAIAGLGLLLVLRRLRRTTASPTPVASRTGAAEPAAAAPWPPISPHRAPSGPGSPAAGGPPATVTAPALPPGPADLEAAMPRWRRPSLLEARKADPLRTAATGARLTFGAGAADLDGLERRLVRYRLVSLLSSPDQVQGVEIGILDRDDEVVVLEQRGTFRRVRCPDGREGWLHRMTLGDLVDGEDRTSWTAADDGHAEGFEAVLRRHEQARARSEGGA